MTEPTAVKAVNETRAGLLASMAIVRASDPKAVPIGAAAMADPTQSTQAAGWCAAILYKLLPAGAGAALMAIVDHPKDRRELAARVIVAFVFSHFLRGMAIDFLHSFGMFSWVDRANDDHKMAVAFLLGCVGWSALGALSMLLKKFRDDPLGTATQVVDDVKKVV